MLGGFIGLVVGFMCRVLVRFMGMVLGSLKGMVFMFSIARVGRLLVWRVLANRVLVGFLMDLLLEF